MRILFIFLFCIGQIAIIEAQQEDNVWMFGGGFGLKDYDGTWGVSYVDFNNEPPDIYFVKKVQLNLRGVNAEICSEGGVLKLYTNGMSIANGQHDFVADTINYGDEWEIHKDFKNDTLIYHDGMLIIQGAMILPDPADSLRYYVMYTQFQRGQNWWEDYVKGLYYSHVDMRLNDGRGGLLSRDVPMVEDSLGWGGLSACRHANGRDWWVVQVGKNREVFHEFLITSDGISDDRVITFNGKYRRTYPLVFTTFSQDGSKYVAQMAHDTCKMSIMDFDRCSGDLEEIYSESYEITVGPQAVVFSDDSRYLFFSNRTELYPDGVSVIYQYDTEAEDIAASKTLVASWDGYTYIYPEDANVPPFEYEVDFGYMGLGPDGRIYVCPTTGSNREMSTIEYPHEGGTACEVRQHSIHIPTNFSRTMPNFPNFRLGPLDGSPCDTLGLDNYPVAKFRYEQDTDYLEVRFTELSYYQPEHWEWDFGDGGTSIERYPTHQYENKGV
ncbi:MAG: PKD domain-containing protein, partial [Saprospiraceae bacterium]|nr:PKD domain-containing protein [Saprospiraceae bacterium]